MAKGAKVGDIGSDHDGFPPTPITSGSPTVKFDGIPAARVGDPLAAHDKPKHPPHPRTISSGSSTVMIDGKPAAMSGCSISCGGVVNVGGGTVNIGDGAGGTAASAPVIIKKSYDIALELLDEQGNALEMTEFQVEMADGKKFTAISDKAGLSKTFGNKSIPQTAKVSVLNSWLIRDV
ncbi:PAAR motif protein [Vibrio ruber DSM 16370]|uniref:PAAR motif protein n=1 Tax=Vibrio ruber (strain DSM 16370 / JCM 11486 / BCRC 17186 / CECT 7878 / LMG 23124 / VR1) TaxID=1123498 RepID=A0A1R4LUG1_VIBR1|nr:PAAR motif protein [Vibrio ruber DSM 16370]